MRFLSVLSVVAVLASLLLATPSAAEAAKTVRGLFGDRTIGGPVAPRPITRFDSGIQRGPSGNLLGIDRDRRFSRERPELRSAIPDVPQAMTTVPPIGPQPVAPYGTRTYVVPTRPSPQPSIQPARPVDTWFRTRGPRNR